MTTTLIPSRSLLSEAFPGFAVSALVAATAQFLSDHYGAPAMLLALHPELSPRHSLPP